MKIRILSIISFAIILLMGACPSSLGSADCVTSHMTTLNSFTSSKEADTVSQDSTEESIHITAPEDTAVSLLFSLTENDKTYLSAADINSVQTDASPSEDIQTTAPEETEAEANIPETEPVKTTSPETKAPVTKAPVTTVPETKAPKTATVTTQAPVTDIVTDMQPEQAPDVKDSIFGDRFLDALAYTGYDVKKQLDSGNLFKKYGSSTPRSVLSDISYSTRLNGLETVSDPTSATGKAPNIASFERSGLCCASYVTYVYYNYLPNIAGINTAGLPRPSSCRSSVAYENAAEAWVRSGKAEKIKFTQSKGYIKPEENIPNGSLIVFESTETGKTAHVALYAGYSNGKHFISHVGNSRGPEIISIDAMYRGDEPERVSGIYVPYFCK